MSPWEMDHPDEEPEDDLEQDWWNEVEAAVARHEDRESSDAWWAGRS